MVSVMLITCIPHVIMMAAIALAMEVMVEVMTEVMVEVMMEVMKAMEVVEVI